MILFFPFDLFSHYSRCLQLAKSVGEEVMFPNSSKYSDLVATAGFKKFTYKGLPTEELIASANDFRFTWLREKLLEEAFLEKVQLIQQFRPSVVVGDATFTLGLAAAYTNVPFVSIINGYMSDYNTLARRLPYEHWINTLFKFIPRSLFLAISIKAELSVMRKLDRPFQRIARKYGIESKSNLLQELQGDITLIVDLPDLFPQRHLPDHHLFIGPLFHLSKGENVAMMDWWQPEKKTLFVSIGSSGDFSKFKFLEDRMYSGFNILVAGETRYVWKAKHICHRTFIHVEDILPKIDLFICHGGNGTIYQALSGGIPVLCAPSHFEQEWNLQGLERWSLGERLEAPNKAYRQG